MVRWFALAFVVSVAVSWRSPSWRPSAPPSRWALYDSTGPEVKSKDLRTILQEAQDDDAAWLQSVLGESLVNQMISAPAAESAPKEEPLRTAPPPAALSPELSSLGYSAADVALIKEGALRAILERGVPRPRTGLPEAWLKGAGDDAREARGGSEPASPGRARASASAGVAQDQGPRPSQGQRRARGAGVRTVQEDDEEDEDDGGRGEAFSWRSPKTDRGMEREREGAGGRGRREGRAEASTRSEAKYGRDRLPPLESLMDYSPPEGPTTFWPDSEEFKAMLLAESRLRVDLLGGWLTPLVKAEARWRFDLYKQWLAFLDEGLGDGFDVVEGAYPEEDQGGWGGQEGEEGEEEEWGGRAGERGRGGAADRGPAMGSSSSRSDSSSSRSSPGRSRNSALAAAYEERLRASIPRAPGGGWTALEEEERGARRSADRPRAGAGERPSAASWLDEDDDDLGPGEEGGDAEAVWLSPPPARSPRPARAGSDRGGTSTSRGRGSGEPPSRGARAIGSEEEFRAAWEASRRRAPLEPDGDDV